MADTDVNEELLDYEDEENTEQTVEAAKNGAETKKEGAIKGNYVSIHSSGFRDFLLKPEVLRAIVDCGFEHPSEVQHECIPQVKSRHLTIPQLQVVFRLSSVWTSWARLSLGWARQQCSCWLHCNRLSLWTGR